jgi:protein-tyrosine-phosphatase
MKKIHFICNGNLYRSRISEAIWNANYSHLAVATSSGVTRNLNNEKYGYEVAWETIFVLRYNNILKHLSKESYQTSQEILNQQDQVVIMHSLIKPIFESEFESKNVIYLNNPDLPDEPDFKEERSRTDKLLYNTAHAQKRFDTISEQLKEIAENLN